MRRGLLSDCGLQWQMCGGRVRVCDDESESEIKEVYSKTSKPFDQSLGKGRGGWRRVKRKRKSAPTIYKTPIRKTSKYTRHPVLTTHVWFLSPWLTERGSFQKGFPFMWGHFDPCIIPEEKKGALSGRSNQAVRDEIIRDVSSFVLPGFVVCRERKNIYSFGSHYTDSSKRNQFFHPWIKFLVSMIAVYPRRSQTPTLQPVLWSVVMSAAHNVSNCAVRYSHNHTSN